MHNIAQIMWYLTHKFASYIAYQLLQSIYTSSQLDATDRATELEIHSMLNPFSEV